MDLVKKNVERAQHRQKYYYDLRRKYSKFQVGDVVWVRSHPLSRAEERFMAKLAAKWKGPAEIVKCLGPVNYSVSFLNDSENGETHHVQNLKTCYGYDKSLSDQGGM